MASTQAQNCQRGIIFLYFLIILFFCIMIIVRTIKKLIDPIQEEAGKYKEGKEGEGNQTKPKPKPKGEDSTLNLDDIAKKSPVVADDDPLQVKVAKKAEELQANLFPLLILFPLNLLTGTAYAFLIVLFFFTLIPLVLFNVLKLHYSCTENKCVRVVLDNLWLILTFFTTINCWAASTLQQPYIVVAG